MAFESAKDEALTRINLRYAIGEITKEQYDQMKMDISPSSSATVRKIVDQIVNSKDIHIKTDVHTDEMFVYTGIVYVTGLLADNIVKRLLLEQGIVSNNQVKDALFQIKTKTYMILERENGHICLENGVFDGSTVVPHDYKMFMTHRIPVTYDTSITYAPWSSFILQLVGIQKYHDTLQEFVGYTFVPHQPAKKLIYAYGNKDCGKSTLFEILTAFFGAENVSHLTPKELTDKFMIQNLRDKLANIRSDIVFTERIDNAGVIKSLTGSDTINAQIKFKPFPIDFVNSAKLYISGNGVPSVPNHTIKDDAFCARWIPLEFKNKFDIDDTILSRWTTPEAKTQILNWALDGLKRLKENNWIFSYHPCIEETRDWFTNSQQPDDVEEYLLQAVIIKPVKWIIKSDLYLDYREWAEKKGYKPRESNVFHRMVHNSRFHTVKRYQPMIDGKQVEAWSGIEFKGAK